jgi:ABC-type branched-subunit amino acid transport system ATPase component
LPALLELRDVTRAFGGVRAADSVSFDVALSTVHGLIGPNGAGKTTVLNLISGMLQPQSGEIRFAGQRIDGLSADRIARLGIRRTFQTSRLFPAMTALENVAVGQHTLRRTTLLDRLVFSPRSRREERELHGEAIAVLGRAGIGARTEAAAGALPYVDQRRLEIARALASHPRLLLLDEPAAGMNPSEAVALGDLVRDLASQGLTVLLVEHNVRLVMSICDLVTVLDFGKVIAGGPPEEVARDETVIAAYLGTGVAAAADRDLAGSEAEAGREVHDALSRLAGDGGAGPE